MSQSFAEKHGTPAGLIQAHGLPAPVTGRADPDINDHVKDRAADAGDVLRLPGGHIGEMHAPQGRGLGNRQVCLRQGERMSDCLHQLLDLEPLEEQSPVVTMLDGREFERPWHQKFANLHGRGY